MSEYDNNFTGALFKNDKKESESHPDYRGAITINGVDYWQSAWLNKDKAGKTYMKQKFTAKDADKAPAPKAALAPALADDFDDLPF